jgi:DNA ligase (NAD+)
MHQATMNRINTLKIEIIKLNNEYYHDDQPSISDEEYDLLFNELKALERENPSLVTEDSPTQSVGGTKTDARFKKAVHVRPMISLDNIYSEVEIREWLTKIAEKLNIPVTRLSWTGEPKLDGLALSLIYENGLLIRGATRGKNNIGEDVSQNALTIKSIPHKLPSPFDVGQVEVRGEVFIHEFDFEAYVAKAIKEEKKKIPKTARNAAAGSLRQSDPSVSANRPLAFYAYSILGEHDYLADTHTERLSVAKNQWGFPVTDHFVSGKGIDTLLKATMDFYSKRNTIGFDTDGWVIKIDSISAQDELGSNSRTPKWAIAHKPQGVVKPTILRGLEVSVTRSGKLNPVIKYDETELGGTSNTSATLFNFDRIAERDYRIGDTVNLKKGGFVIPVILNVNMDLRPDSTVAILPPSECPCCGCEVEKVEAQHFCTGGLVCPAQSLDRIVYFASKDCMDIYGLGFSTLTALFEKNLITMPSDIYKLTVDDFVTLDKHTEHKAKKIVKSILVSKKTSLTRFITAIGIRGVGKGSASDLANAFNDIQGLIGANQSTIASIDGFSDLSAKSICTFFANQAMMDEVSLLLGHLSLSHEVSASNIFDGMMFVVTGGFDKLARRDIENAVKDNKGKVSGTVSKKTNYLIQGTGGGRKYDDAMAINADGGGINILDENEVVEFFSEKGIIL